jgi:hypothetical protein
MHLGRTALRGSVLAFCAASALTLGVGAASASTLNLAPQAAAISSSHPADCWDCDGWRHHGDWRCYGDGWGYYCDDWRYHGGWRCHGDCWD